jgi:microcystin-dependent protein
LTDAYVGEIRWLPYSRSDPPINWLFCDGSQQPISTYEVLYTLIGTTYGGNGVTTFGLPDLRGRVPLHFGTGTGLSPRPLATASGTEGVTLLTSQMPIHSHIMMASSAAATNTTPTNSCTLGAIDPTDTLYTSGNGSTPTASLVQQSVGVIGGSQPHENCAPTLAINAYICCTGLFPSQS